MHNYTPQRYRLKLRFSLKENGSKSRYNIFHMDLMEVFGFGLT